MCCFLWSFNRADLIFTAATLQLNHLISNDCWTCCATTTRSVQTDCEGEAGRCCTASRSFLDKTMLKVHAGHNLSPLPSLHSKHEHTEPIRSSHCAGEKTTETQTENMSGFHQKHNGQPHLWVNTAQCGLMINITQIKQPLYLPVPITKPLY